MTNILVEGGSMLLGSLFDAGQIDEVHVFIAPKLFGGQKARSAIRGAGIEQIADALSLEKLRVQMLGDDIYVSGRIRRPQ
jgi:diaminohydroxyphosphoribosylaminopyrimidine deaminase/5-amino-6-(5-phosphoribosylamino)uracil reductase